MPRRLVVLLSFAAVYVIWGSTYLAIRFAIETLPGFLMAGCRFLFAGLILYAYARPRSGAPPRGSWGAAAIVGSLLLLGGNGGVVWAQHTVPSGVAAILVAMLPIFMAVLEPVVLGGRLPRGRKAAGILVGFAGVAVLAGPRALAPGAPVAPIGVAVLLAASASWALGSLLSRRLPLPRIAPLSTSMQLICGGAALLLMGTLTGEWSQAHPAAFSTRSALAFAYLVVFGSIVAFSAYAWLIRNVAPGLVATYAYVNPIVAVFLGWALAGESLTPRILGAAAVIIAGVVLITFPSSMKPRA